MRRPEIIAMVIAALVVGWPAASAAASTCSDYLAQAAAQRAADTSDPDGDGLYCESLPCPCLAPAPSQTPPTPSPAPSNPSPSQPIATPVCTTPPGVQPIRPALSRRTTCAP